MQINTDFRSDKNSEISCNIYFHSGVKLLGEIVRNGKIGGILCMRYEAGHSKTCDKRYDYPQTRQEMEARNYTLRYMSVPYVPNVSGRY